jgi:hypothetical protein
MGKSTTRVAFRCAVFALYDQSMAYDTRPERCSATKLAVIARYTARSTPGGGWVHSKGAT